MFHLSADSNTINITLHSGAFINFLISGHQQSIRCHLSESHSVRNTELLMAGEVFSYRSLLSTAHYLYHPQMLLYQPMLLNIAVGTASSWENMSDYIFFHRNTKDQKAFSPSVNIKHI